MAKRPLRTALSLIAGILITIGGCSEHPSTAGADTEQQFRQVQLSAPGGGVRANRGILGEQSSKVIGPEGGTLSISGGHKLEFPAGALSEPTEITARGGRVFVEAEFGPHGLQFPAGHEPVLTLSYKDAVNLRDESSLKVAYMEGARTTEVLTGQVDTSAKTVSVRIEHFSRYALVGH